MILPESISQFFNRRLEDFRWLKKAPRKEVWKTLSWKKFLTKPRDHQLVCQMIGQKYPRFQFFLDMGGGKTKIGLDLFRYRLHTGQAQRGLVCVPNLINLDTWERQVATHAADLRVTILEGTQEKRTKALKQNADLFIVNYAGLPVYMAPLRKKGRKLNRQLATKFAAKFDFLILDEIHLMGGHDSLQFELVAILSEHARYVYGMTGTPFGRDPIKLWSEFAVVDQGITLGPTLELFRAAYYNKERLPWFGPWAARYNFDNQLRGDLRRMIQHRSIRYTSKEMGHDGKIQRQTLRVPMTKEQHKHYTNIQREFIEARKTGERVAFYIRARQITAGFIASGKDEERLEVQLASSAKVDGLAEFISERERSTKVLIYHQYIFSGIMIQDLLRKRKISFAGVGSGFKQPRDQVYRFMHDPRCEVFLANWAAGGTGVDGLQEVCHVGIFFESPSDPSRRKQCEMRLDRPGQKETVLIYDLVCSNTVDERVLISLAEGKDLLEEVTDGKVKTL